MILTTAYDPIFKSYAGKIPVAYLRALAYRESSFNPRNTEGPAWGLMQVVEVVRDSYNRRKGTSYSRQDLLDPKTNVKIAADLINRIANAYSKHSDPNMQPDWGNPEFVKLITAGWNSGYSEAGGVGRVASYLESRGLPVTHDNVFRYAGSAGATQWLQKSGRQNWQRSVSDLYFTQPDAGEVSGIGSFLIKAGIAVGAGLLFARALR